MTAERPPEGWLLKAWCGETLIDLIFHPAGGPVGDEHFERAELLEVMAQPLPVASLDDVIVTKLLSLTEQEPNFTGVLELARSLREQIDRGWCAAEPSRRRSPVPSSPWSRNSGSSSCRKPRSRRSSRPPTSSPP